MVNFEQAGVIAELGAGDGVITHHILRSLDPKGKLLAFEVLPQLSEHLHKIEDSRLIVVEDSAETIGGEYKGKRTGSFGVGCFSFYPTKNMSTGEGGILTTYDDQLAKKVEALIAHGLESSTFQREKKEKPWLRAATYAGHNFRLCDILAAVGNVQLSKLDLMNDKRRAHSRYLLENLSNVQGLQLPVEPEGYKHVYQMFVVRVDASLRSSFVTKLRDKGIGASVHFDPPVHSQPYYEENYPTEGLNVTKEMCERIVTIPMFPGLTKEELDYIVSSIKETLSVLQ